MAADAWVDVGCEQEGERTGGAGKKSVKRWFIKLSKRKMSVNRELVSLARGLKG